MTGRRASFRGHPQLDKGGASPSKALLRKASIQMPGQHPTTRATQLFGLVGGVGRGRGLERGRGPGRPPLHQRGCRSVAARCPARRNGECDAGYPGLVGALHASVRLPRPHRTARCARPNQINHLAESGAETRASSAPRCMQVNHGVSGTCMATNQRCAPIARQTMANGHPRKVLSH